VPRLTSDPITTSRTDPPMLLPIAARTQWSGPGYSARRLSAPSGRLGQPGATEPEDTQAAIDLEQIARDQIAKVISVKYTGHGMARLVEALLNAQGYITFLSPEGADKGVDILAAAGPLGFASPRICVQVKSGDSPVDRPTLDQLIGAMQNFKADRGLLVSWAGFKSSVERERPQQFFNVRLWDQAAFISELLAVYDRLPDEVRADLPLKRIWTITSEDEAL
jgi:restriction system protein